MEILKNTKFGYMYDSKEELFEMAKISKKYADKNICKDFGDFIYFSEVLSGHSPRIKFYGGTAETRSTREAPSFTITQNGAGDVELEPWMNRKNCPNAFDKDYVAKVRSFINDHVAILLLIWFRKLDEADGLAYFQGMIDLSTLLSQISCEDYLQSQLISVKSEEELNEFCLTNDMYRF